MKVHYECLTCMATQCQRIAEMATQDLELRKKAMFLAAKLIAREYHENAIPAIAGSLVFLELYKFLGNDDPFKKYKERSNAIARDVVKLLKEKLDIDFKTAVKLAIIGNVIDFSVGFSPEKLEEEVEKMLSEELYIDESDELLREIKRARSILYLTDNVGEHHFDAILLEKIKEVSRAELYIAGKEGAIINDVTVEDLKRDGFERFGRIVSTGTRIVGVPINDVSDEFRRIFEESDIIIAKGQGNFETLSELKDERVFFLLKAKCPAVARELKVPRGALVCMRNATRR
ncbi:damage-control phosphatase [Pyrococcus abyssi]|uniref:Damage-control phosphatase ARMT1-like metal-binding domain-containing protein n=1 Tax=Pyrococcus abyssi (strain GE5 / Orsay) TaxID=272844 RepID=Q9V143_PYRAB|nr:damage-control phosphatase [Pyrococcus abyssi]CAB49508.1 Hypothetical protein PAB1965 [Pyrococcus abyssi GE5]CCE69978.1 TPA: hypothetical protein PAB1965 [Pyrococcus abyssi GE5]